jgi:hypothetical protein
MMPGYWEQRGWRLIIKKMLSADYADFADFLLKKLTLPGLQKICVIGVICG